MVASNTDKPLSYAKSMDLEVQCSFNDTNLNQIINKHGKIAIEGVWLRKVLGQLITFKHGKFKRSIKML